MLNESCDLSSFPSNFRNLTEKHLRRLRRLTGLYLLSLASPYFFCTLLYIITLFLLYTLLLLYNPLLSFTFFYSFTLFYSFTHLHSLILLYTLLLFYTLTSLLLYTPLYSFTLFYSFFFYTPLHSLAIPYSSKLKKTPRKRSFSSRYVINQHNYIIFTHRKGKSKQQVL